MLKADTLAAIRGAPINDNGMSVLAGLSRYGQPLGFDQPHRLAQLLAQLLHESMGFKYDEEIASGAAYEGRADLGNTQPGDGKRFKGRGAIQITGRYNYTAFSQWCAERFPDAPDFVANPEAVNTNPWEGIAPIWYWARHDLNRYADIGDIESITEKVNGGLNGYSDRVRWYGRCALVLLGRAPDDVRGFQSASGLSVDGIVGPRTRAAMHAALRAAPDLSGPPPANSAPQGIIAAIIAIFALIFGKRS